jgi:hypothetical protein
MLLMGYPLEKLFECCFFWGRVALIRHPIFWKLDMLRNPKEWNKESKQINI